MGKPLNKTELQQLQAKIVLLQALNDTPSQPAEKPLVEDHRENRRSAPRVLSLFREKELTENLAFIASTTDDPAKVLALAIEEENAGQGMNITLAVNNGLLENVRTGFEKMAKVLHNIRREGVASQKHQDDLLMAIVSLNHNRILCRLRSRHATLRCNFKKEKLERPKTIPILKAAFEQITTNGQPVLFKDLYKRLASLVGTLDRIFIALENLKPSIVVAEQGRKLLVELVKTASELSTASGFPAILNRCKLDPNSREFVTNAIRKLGRYCTATRFLCQAASRFSIFSQIRISIIKLPAIPLPAISDPEELVNGIITDMFKIKESQDATSKLLLRFKNRKVQYSQVCTSIASVRPVVHAEIQLLVHYESQNLTLPPRIICSSKKACFLCNLFIELHGKYIVPSTHGKLYEKWTLPASLTTLTGDQNIAMQSAVRSFDTNLNERLQREILVAEKRFPAPCESIVFGSAVWSELREPSPSPIRRVDSGYDDGEKEDVASSSSTTIRSLGQFETPVTFESPIQPSPIEAKSPIQSESPVLLMPPTPIQAESPYTMLKIGESMSFELSRYAQLVKVATPRLHLTISYEAWEQSLISLASAEIRSGTMGCRLSVSWLEDPESLDPCSKVVDLAIFPDSFQNTFDQLAGSCDFYVKKGRDVVSIQTTYT
ncbi:hypothetical protein BKA64DRAFT_61062 [Cadophora sp. MPI-SDFR-AT-0126]|nr:hypothetical protein BKA64DRAFT_61062 [Leotiomycetes sp. MPI-SDFR-AT-0126]